MKKGGMWDDRLLKGGGNSVGLDTPDKEGPKHLYEGRRPRKSIDFQRTGALIHSEDEMSRKG